jgi:hypothetical protein
MKLEIEDEDLFSACYAMECAILDIATRFMDDIGNEQLKNYERMYKELKKRSKKECPDLAKSDRLMIARANKIDLDITKNTIKVYYKIRKALDYLTKARLNSFDEEARKQIDILWKYRGIMWY